VTAVAPPARRIAVARAEDVPRLEARAVTVDGVRIAIYHTDRGFRATAAECPHKGGPLADGLVGDDCVTCPLHNWRIDLQTGAVAGEEGVGVAVYPVVERKGWLYLEVPS
jgi:nitrite reductase (NADH) small subunit